MAEIYVVVFPDPVVVSNVNCLAKNSLLTRQARRSVGGLCCGGELIVSVEKHVGMPLVLALQGR